MISVKNLTKTFKGVAAVEDLSFEIETGQVVGFLGPNGAGKTTTMRLLSGYITPDSGEVSIDGQSPFGDKNTVLKNIGYLPENNPLYKDMLVSEFLDFSASLKGLSGFEKKDAFDFVVRAVSIGDVYNKPIKELSKGYKQRVGMAAALLHKPKVVLLDEPTEGLDPNQRTEIRSLIRDLAKDRTILISTHVMQEASALSDRVLIINKGKLVADGTPEELAQKAQSGRRFYLEVEGVGVGKALKALPGVTDVEMKTEDHGRMQIYVSVHADAVFQPDLSHLVRDHAWVLWKLVEEEYKLEDVFEKLTK